MFAEMALVWERLDVAIENIAHKNKMIFFNEVLPESCAFAGIDMHTSGRDSTRDANE
jgi:hypothetical protein